jgi:hypothetical protein
MQKQIDESIGLLAVEASLKFVGFCLYPEGGEVLIQRKIQTGTV